MGGEDGADGTPERVLGILVDDTEAWAQARACAETAEQPSLALTLANIVVFRHDLASDRLSVSERAFDLLGLTDGRTELSTEELRALVHPDDRAALRGSLERALASGPPVDVETRLRHTDGSWLERAGGDAPVALERADLRAARPAQ